MHLRRLLPRKMHRGMIPALAYLTILGLASTYRRHYNSSKRVSPGNVLPKLQFGKADLTADRQIGSSTLEFQQRRRAIVIIAGFRTGSSFVGEFFNQHPDTFYFFEPLFHKFWNHTDRVSDGEIIKDLLLCNITSMRNALLKTWKDMMKYYESSPSRVLLTKLSEIERCINTGICFRHKSKRLCEPQLCQNNVSNRVACKAHCRPVTAKMLEQECSQAKVRVIKVIRLNDILQLKRSWSHPNINLKILHLTRDPRSSWLSRASVTTRTHANEMTGRECKKDLKIYSEIMSNSTDYAWLEEIYSLIRYEEVTESPLKQALSIYNSLRIKQFEVQKSVVDWIERNTKVSDHLIFGTSRNSTAQNYEWRRHIKMNEVEDVQELCHTAMLRFGYTRIRNKAHLADFRHGLTKPILHNGAFTVRGLD